MAAEFVFLPGLALIAVVYLGLLAGSIYLAAREQTHVFGLVACALLLVAPLAIFLVVRTTVVEYPPPPVALPVQVTLPGEFQEQITLPPMPTVPAPVFQPQVLTPPAPFSPPTPQQEFASQARFYWGGVSLFIFIILAVAMVVGFVLVLVLIPKNVRSGTLKGALICAALIGAAVGLYFLREGEAPGFRLRVSPRPMLMEQLDSLPEGGFHSLPSSQLHPTHPVEVPSTGLLSTNHDALHELARQALEEGTTPSLDASQGTKIVEEKPAESKPAEPAPAAEPPPAAEPAPAVAAPTEPKPAEAPVAEATSPEPAPAAVAAPAVATPTEPKPAEAPVAEATSPEPPPAVEPAPALAAPTEPN
ncbi:MAG: hypothetical protein SFX18_07470, partial [Pirellulales bacterium]|nr:hypothetical protein [Pirellulales bacterium]